MINAIKKINHSTALTKRYYCIRLQNNCRVEVTDRQYIESNRLPTQTAVINNIILKEHKTDVTPAILTSDFVAQLYRVTKLQYATVHVAHCDSVALKRSDQSGWSVLVYATKLPCATCIVAYCNFVA